MPLKASVQMTYEIFLQYNRFNMYKKTNGRMPPVQFALMIILAFAFGGLGIVYRLLIGKDALSTAMFVLFGIYVLLAALVIYSYCSAPKRLWNSNKISHNAVSNYTFTYDYFSVEETGGAVNANANVSYDGLFMVYETPDCYYFYISKVQAYVVPKGCITEGDIYELSRFLDFRLTPAKFRQCFKK